MKEINEEELHLYVLNKTLLDKNILYRIEKLAAIDEAFQKELYEIKEFYSNYDRISSNRSSVYFLGSPEAESSGHKPIKLAAMQSISESTELTYLKTFFTGDNYLITRLFYNSNEQSYNLFVLSENDKVDVANAVLFVAGIKKEFIADEKGIINIKSRFIDFPEQIIIHLPLAKFDIIKNDLIQFPQKSFLFQDGKNNFKLELELNENTLNVSLQTAKGSSGKLLKLIIFNPGNEPDFVSVNIDGNKCSITLPDFENFRIMLIEV